MKHPAVDSLEIAMRDYEFASIEHGRTGENAVAVDEAADKLREVIALTRPPGGSERLRERLLRTAASERELADALIGRCKPLKRERHLRFATLLNEAAAALASPQGAEPDRVATALRDALAYVGQRTDGDLATLAERAELWMRESKCLIAEQGAEQRQEPTLDQIDRAVRSLPSGYTFGDAVEHATPHPEPAATQGDAVALSWLDAVLGRMKGQLQASDAAFDWKIVRDFHADLCRVRANLSSPPGVQAAQVSDDKECNFESAEALAEWLESLHETNDDGAVTGRTWEPAQRAAAAIRVDQSGVVLREQEALLNPATQVFFRAGLIASREYMARFVQAESPSIAASIRANWWPSLDADFGPPRKIDWSELTDGEYGTDTFRVKPKEEVSPTLEALPIALGFLEQQASPATALASQQAVKP